jgi:hypothetical protein
MEKFQSPNTIGLDISACLFLSLLGNFLPPWADWILLVAVFVWNVVVAMRLKWNLPSWFVVLLVCQIMALASSFATDHDPFDWEWGGISEPTEWF